MTVAELKSGIEKSSAEDRAFLAAFIKQLARKDDPAYRAGLTQLNNEFDRGKKYSLAQVKRLPQKLI